MLESIGQLIIKTSDFIWGAPVLILLLGGGFYFLIYSRLVPLRYFGHAIGILAGKHKDTGGAGQIKPYQALATALAGTIGMGNVSGVAVAITMGGPGAVFWMWVTALLGVSTEFFSNTLSVMFRGKDSNGETQGGPMYYITEGLGKNWKPMAIFFSVVGMIGVSPLFQANQLTQMIAHVLLTPNQIETSFTSDLITGFIISIIVAVVVIGGIKRIGKVTGSLVPLMVGIYTIAVLYIIFSNSSQIVPAFKTIFNDAFSGDAVLGGSLGSIIVIGVRRAAFSNEAGLGTTPMAHGASKTSEPVRQGLIAMLGPVIDTIVVCTMTALAIIITNMWIYSNADGITLTAQAFDSAIPVFGKYILGSLCYFLLHVNHVCIPLLRGKMPWFCCRGKIRTCLQLHFCTYNNPWRSLQSQGNYWLYRYCFCIDGNPDSHFNSFVVAACKARFCCIFYKT